MGKVFEHWIFTALTFTSHILNINQPRMRSVGLLGDLQYHWVGLVPVGNALKEKESGQCAGQGQPGNKAANSHSTACLEKGT